MAIRVVMNVVMKVMVRVVVAELRVVRLNQYMKDGKAEKLQNPNMMDGYEGGCVEGCDEGGDEGGDEGSDED